MIGKLKVAFSHQDKCSLRGNYFLQKVKLKETSKVIKVKTVVNKKLVKIKLAYLKMQSKLAGIRLDNLAQNLKPNLPTNLIIIKK